MTFSQRIAEALNYAKTCGKTQSSIAEEIRKMEGGQTFQQATLSALKSRDSSEGSTYTTHIAKACGISPFWLALEEGPMVSNDQNTTDHLDIQILIETLETVDYLEERFTKFTSIEKKAAILAEIYRINREKHANNEPALDTSNIILLANIMKQDSKPEKKANRK